MGSHSNKVNTPQASTTTAATPTGVGGPMTSAPMTAAMRKNPVSNVPMGKGYIPGVTDKGPKLPGMAAGYDSHGLVIPQPVQQPRNTLAQLLQNRFLNSGSGSDRGGYTTSGSGWGGNSSANAGYGMGGSRG